MSYSESEVRSIVIDRNPDENDTTIDNMTAQVLSMIERAVQRIFEEEA